MTARPARSPRGSWWTPPGPRGFLHRALGLPEARFPRLPETEALYAHFADVRRLDALPIFPSAEAPPYPVDDAAVHHVFDGGWIWVLRFANGLVSAGVAAAPPLARELALAEGEAAWRRLLAHFPTVAEQFADARTATPWFHRRPMPFRSGAAAGPGWTMLPSAAAFVDPLLSTGFPLTLLGIERLAAAIREHWGTPAFEARLREDAATTLAEVDAAAALVAALYAHFGDFEVFAALTHLYFAAASYAEAARRLGRPDRSGSFLSADHPTFGPALAACCRLALARDSSRRRDTPRRRRARDRAPRRDRPLGPFAAELVPGPVRRPRRRPPKARRLARGDRSNAPGDDAGDARHIEWWGVACSDSISMSAARPHRSRANTCPDTGKEP